MQQKKKKEVETNEVQYFRRTEMSDLEIKIDREKALLALSDALELGKSDPEIAHVNADKVLCELLTSLGFSDVVEEFKKVPKWYA